MKAIHLVLPLCAVTALAACEGNGLEGIREYGADKSVDRGVDRKDLSQLQWGIWVDPDGCDNWIADDGVEGYLVRRWDRYGKPICSGVAPPTVATGDFKEGSSTLVGDPL